MEDEVNELIISSSDNLDDLVLLLQVLDGLVPYSRAADDLTGNKPWFLAPNIKCLVKCSWLLAHFD